MDPLSLRPEHTALLVVDIQERLVPAMPEAAARRMVAAVELLLDAAGRFELPVFVTEQYPKGLGPTVPSLASALASLQEKKLVRATKAAFDACACGEVTRGLADAGVRSVVLVGVEAHVCVFMTARELLRRGYYVHVPFDAVASRDPECRRTALELLARHGAAVTTTETVVFDLLRDAQSEHFRALSKRVRDLV